MNTRILSLLLLGALAGAAGCLDDRGQDQVQFSQICAPTTDCTFAATCSAQFIGGLQLDISQQEHVFLYGQFNNTLPSNADLANGRLNTNDAHLTEVEIAYDGAALPGGVAPPPPFNAEIPAGGATTTRFYAVTPAAGAALAALPATAFPLVITARIRGRGYYDNGREFETGEFPLRIEVCDGCLGAPAACAAPQVQVTCPPESAGQVPSVTTCVDP